MAAVSSETKKRQLRDLSFWLITLAWGTGAFIYGWLLAGTLHKREYWNFTFEALGWADWGLALICGLVAGGVSFCISFFTKPSDSESQQLFRIVVAVLPALFLVSALAVLTLTLATYNVYWKEARQGIATAFAALIAAVGVVVSVAVSYKTGEENRLLQKQTEQQKLDAELIKSLNDRLHEIIARRYSSKNAEGQEEISGLVSASYFQLASLYKDWETLSTTSKLISQQKENQQRNILKLLFGVYQESGDGESSKRSEVDIRTLNSIIQDIFPSYQANDEEESQNESETKETPQPSFDLSYLDLRGLDISMRDLRKANLVGARLEGSNLMGVHLEKANLVGAHLEGASLRDAHLEGANLQGAHLEGAYLWGAHLEGAYLWGAHLEGAYLWGAHLEGANLRDAHLEGADLIGAQLKGANLQGAHLEGADLLAALLEDGVNLIGAHLEGAKLWATQLEEADLRGAHLLDTSFFVDNENPQDIKARERIIYQLKDVKHLPRREELLKVKDFDEALVDDIIKAHEEYQAGKKE